MRFEPVSAHAVIHHQTDFERGGGLHGFGDDGHDALLLGAEHIDDQFVMHLQDHLRADAFGGETAVYVDHGDLHDVGRRTLNRSVHGVSLGKAAGDGVVRSDVVEVAAPAENRRDEALFLGLGNHVVHILLTLG